MNPLEQFDRISPAIMPATVGYTGAGLVNAWLSIASTVQTHHATITDAFLQISLAAISSFPAVIGGVTLAGGVWLKHLRQTANDEREFRLKMADRGFSISTEATSKFMLDPRCAKPSDDTVDVP